VGRRVPLVDRQMEGCSVNRALHEDYGRRVAPVRGSGRAFGIVMAVAVPVVALILVPSWFGPALDEGFVSVVVALRRPHWLGRSQ